MRTSFVVLVSRLGLEALLPECAISCGWLRQAAPARQAACLWAVMQPDQAAGIQELLAAGEGDWALGEFARAAEFKGPLHDFPVRGSCEATR